MRVLELERVVPMIHGDRGTLMRTYARKKSRIQSIQKFMIVIKMIMRKKLKTKEAILHPFE